MKRKLLNRYVFTCPFCRCEQEAEPSLLMRLGHNIGHGCCLNCKEFLHLKINEKNTEMLATPWENYVNEVRERIKNEIA